jgi:hypothetical protein
MTFLGPRYELNPTSAITTESELAMLYAAGVPNKEMMKTAPHVG